MVEVVVLEKRDGVIGRLCCFESGLVLLMLVTKMVQEGLQCPPS